MFNVLLQDLVLFFDTVLSGAALERYQTRGSEYHPGMGREYDIEGGLSCCRIDPTSLRTKNHTFQDYYVLRWRLGFTELGNIDSACFVGISLFGNHLKSRVFPNA